MMASNKMEMNDEYFIPLKPDHALALTMNFPQFSETNRSKDSFNQMGFIISIHLFQYGIVKI